MRPLKYTINLTIDGCCDHLAGIPDNDLHRHFARKLEIADALLYGRTTYQMMESAWREPGETGKMAEWMEPWMMAFAKTVNDARKYVFSSTMPSADWNAELVRGDAIEFVRDLKQQSGNGLLLGGVKFPLALANAGLIDEYEFVIHPRIAGHGPTLFSGLTKYIDLDLTKRSELPSGSVVLTYAPKANMPWNP